MTRKYKYIILGAGPSGLACARTLLDRGERSILVLERHHEVGGLCRSASVDGSPLDIGGGHFLDTSRRQVLDFVFRFFPESEWCRYPRKSTIRYGIHEIDYPFEANLWQLPVEDQVDFLASMSAAGCNRDEPAPEPFSDWVRWSMGNRIADEYMLPYNRKIWSTDLKRLGTYWMNKLPSVSFRQALRSCLGRSSEGTLPCHTDYLYPRRHGYGEPWKKIGDSLGDRLLVNTPVEYIDAADKVINETYQADLIVSTIPWPFWKAFGGVPDSVLAVLDQLEYVGIQVDYHGAPGHSDAHWTYVPDETVSYHRILWRSNFCPGSRGYWTETNTSRANGNGAWSHVNRFAYPSNTMTKPAAMHTILKWAASRNIVGLGRWGQWEHMNSDVAVERGMRLATRLIESASAGSVA